ncbi:hypothetical protein AB1484_19790 [Parafrankia sp. FMc6]
MHPVRLSRPWIPAHLFLDQKEIIARTPDYLKKLNVFAPARDLATA